MSSGFVSLHCSEKIDDLVSDRASPFTLDDGLPEDELMLEVGQWTAKEENALDARLSCLESPLPDDDQSLSGAFVPGAASPLPRTMAASPSQGLTEAPSMRGPSPSSLYDADILRYLLSLEDEYRPNANMLDEQQMGRIEVWMRETVLLWVVEVRPLFFPPATCSHGDRTISGASADRAFPASLLPLFVRREQTSVDYDMWDETVSLAVVLLDRFLSAAPLARSALHLAGAACLLIACKANECDAPSAADLCVCLRNTATPDEIKGMELHVLKTLQWKINGPTPHAMLRNLTAVLPADLAASFGSMYEDARVFVDMSYCAYAFLNHKYSVQAAAAMTLVALKARRHRDMLPFLERYGISVAEVEACAKDMEELHEYLFEKRIVTEDGAAVRCDKSSAAIGLQQAGGVRGSPTSVFGYQA